MPEELLQRLRDIHYPDAPGWFPPAPGWWVVAALVIGLFGWLTVVWRKRAGSRAPYAIALKLLDQAHAERLAGTLTARAYLDNCNQVIKRLLIHVRHNATAVNASGTDWLLELDRLHDSTRFTNGPGAVLGSGRYAREVPDEPSELHELLVDLVTRLRNTAQPAPDRNRPTGEPAQEEVA